MTGAQYAKKHKHKPVPRVVEVLVWHDASFYEGQLTTRDALRQCGALIVTIGHFIGESEGMIALCSDLYDGTGTYRVEHRRVHYIPIENVVSRKRIKVKL